MYKYIFILLISLLYLLSGGCSFDEETASDLSAPSMEILTPADSTIFMEGEIIEIRSSAEDNIEVERVEYSINDSLAGQVYSSPWLYEWNTEGCSGEYQLSGYAFDLTGNMSEKDSLKVRIYPTGSCVLHGYLRNALEEGICGVRVELWNMLINEVSAQYETYSNEDGYYEFAGIDGGIYVLCTYAEDYRDASVDNLQLFGLSEYDLLLYSSQLPQVASIELVKNGGILQAEWENLSNSTLAGYNFYLSEFCIWEDDWEVSGGISIPADNDWKLQNCTIIPDNYYEDTDYKLYNVVYTGYACGVTIDGWATPRTDSTAFCATEIELMGDELLSFDLTQQTGELELPQTDHELSLHLGFSDVGWDMIRNNLSQWSVEIETSSGWQEIGINEALSDPRSGWGKTVTCSLNEYKGESVRFRTVPGYYTSLATTLEIENRVMEYSLDGSGFVHNEPPAVPDLEYPSAGAEDIGLEIELCWNCSDPEGDDLIYFVYLATNDMPNAGDLIAEYYEETSISVSLDYETEYFWKVKVYDGEYWQESAVSSFTTEIEVIINVPPDEPYYMVPPNGSDWISIVQNLYWSCSDPNGDHLTYDVFMSTDGEITAEDLVSDDQSGTFYNAGEMPYNTTFYWQIVSCDGEYETAGAIWHFTTRPHPVCPFELVNIPAGEYMGGEDPQEMTINYTYDIMKYPVTVTQYAQYLTHALASGNITVWGDFQISGWYEGDPWWMPGEYYLYMCQDIICENGVFTVVEGTEDFPIQVSWFGAYLFADYYGMRLPTVEEWEKAARGMNSYEYPFGATLSPYRANYACEENIWESKSPVDFFNGQNYNGFQTIDSPSAYGCYDMCGNVYEWTITMNIATGDKAQKGGGWWHQEGDNELKVWYNRYYTPNIVPGGVIRGVWIRD